MKMRLQVDMPEKWICQKNGFKMDLPEKWIENGSAGKMDLTNFQFDKLPI